MVAELQAKFVKVDVDRTSDTSRARHFIQSSFDRPELKIAGRVVEDTTITKNGAVESVAKPYFDSLQPLNARFRLRVMKLGFRQPREKTGLALAASFDIRLDLRTL